MILLSKTKMNVNNDCFSCSYNTEFNIDISRPNDEIMNENISDNEELHCDSFQTLPPPPAPVFRSASKHPLPVCYNLKNLK